METISGMYLYSMQHYRTLFILCCIDNKSAPITVAMVTNGIWVGSFEISENWLLRFQSVSSQDTNEGSLITGTCSFKNKYDLLYALDINVNIYA